MGYVTGKNISFSELCEIIDLYKRASIDGDRIDFIVSLTEDEKRSIKIKLQNGSSIKESIYLFGNKDEFDNNVLLKILNYFIIDDSICTWNTEEDDDSDMIKGIIETQSGNMFYIDTFNKELFDKLKKQIILTKGNLTNEDKVWDEIIQYSKNIRLLGMLPLTDDEINTVYGFLLKQINNDRIKYKNSKNAIDSNEKYLNELFANKEKLLEENITEETIAKINQNIIKALAVILGSEKRIRYRLDVDDDNIREKLKYVVYELDGVGYFDLKNKITKETPTIKCKMGVVSKLLSLLNHERIYPEELKDRYKGYCYEIVGYLYRKGMNHDINEDFNYIIFQEYSLDQEEKNTKDLTSNEIEEIISFVEESKNSGNNRKDKELFVVVKHGKIKEESNEVIEIRDAYEKSLNYSTDDYPSWIKILFENESDNEADVIISNKSGAQDLVIYRRPISVDKLQNEIMDVLRKLFTKNNNIHYNIKYKLDDTNSSCLLIVGDKKTTFSIINAPNDFVDYNKKMLEESMGQI